MMKSVLACVCMCVCAHHQACSCHLLLNYVLFLITSTQKRHCLHKFLVQFVDFIASRRTASFVFLFLVFFTQKPHICCHQMYFELACKIQVFCAYNSMASTYHLHARSPLHTHAPPMHTMHARLYNVHLWPSTPCAHLHTCAHTPRTSKGKEH